MMFNNKIGQKKSNSGDSNIFTWIIVHFLFIIFFVNVLLDNLITSLIFDFLAFFGTDYIPQLILLVSVLAIDIGLIILFATLNLDKDKSFKASTIFRAGIFALLGYFILDYLIFQTAFETISILA